MELIAEYKAEEFLKLKGFPIVERKLCRNATEAFEYAKSIGFPVVLKIASKEIIHKSDIGGVMQNIEESNFLFSFNKLMNLKLKKEGVIVQKYIQGEYLFLGLKKDTTFGYILIMGSGGIYTEITHDVSFRIPPLAKKEILEMLKELKIYKILSGARSQKFNISSIISLVLKLQNLAKPGKIKELDINPLIVNSKGSFIIDAKIIFD